MTTFYHVAPATYQDGDDLICLVRRANGNYELAARYARRRWPEYPDYAIGPDAHLVSLYESRTDASDHAGTHGGVILEIDGAYLDLVRNSEGFPAVHDRIPAKLIRRT